MFQNEVTLLKKENKKQSSKLGENDEKTINNIMKSINIFKVNSYDAQVIHRDLIGMAQDAELRDSDLEEAIGRDIKEFTEEIVKNSIGPSRIEIVLSFLIKACGYFLILFIALSYGAYGSLSWKADPIIMVYYIAVVLVSFIVEGLITPLFNLEKGIKRIIPSLISLFMFVMLTMIISLVYSKQNAVNINAGRIIAVSAALYFLSTCLNVQNIHRLAKEKKNCIKDLIDRFE
ncbi:hypothetical protein [Lutispora sp.]|uniref:hypothetical protein n=1 Tax=Lutispora sp. TaxID=2828727 RepID=UPI002B1EA2A3|nr:hypothetical protein [Lutispora sp.]MEA4962497.1 hypothetical protein [Lutispora sp.]